MIMKCLSGLLRSRSRIHNFVITTICPKPAGIVSLPASAKNASLVRCHCREQNSLLTSSFQQRLTSHTNSHIPSIKWHSKVFSASSFVCSCPGMPSSLFTHQVPEIAVLLNADTWLTLVPRASASESLTGNGALLLLLCATSAACYINCTPQQHALSNQAVRHIICMPQQPHATSGSATAIQIWGSAPDQVPIRPAPKLATPSPLLDGEPHKSHAR